MPDHQNALAQWADSRVRAASTTMLRELPDGSSVVLDLKTEQYFGLDAIAADMWSALIDSPTVGQARDALLATYDVDPERLNSDLSAFVEALASRGLVVVDGDQSAV